MRLLTPLIIVLLISSCAKNGQQVLFKESSQAMAMAEEIRNKADQRKIIYSASLELAVEEPDSVASQLINKISTQGGVLQSRQNLVLNFKVNPTKLKSLFSDLKQLGTVKSEYMGSQDVTDIFYDTEARLENLKKVRDRYLELLAKSENVQDILSVEKELERINGDIDVLQGRLNRTEKDINQADLTVTLTQKKKAGILGAIGKGIYSGVKWLFVRG